MYIKNLKQARKAIGERVYWDDGLPRYLFPRNGVLTNVYNRQLEMDNTQDFQDLIKFTNLRTTKD